MGISLVLARLRGEIYFGAEYLNLDLYLYLCFFKNVGYIKKDIRKHMRKRI